MPVTTTPGFLSGKIASSQNLSTITYPIAGGNLAISNVSKATTAVVTSSNKLPPSFVSGTKVIINGVKGMTQLPTAGIGSSCTYYAQIASPTTFKLYTDSNLQNAVNSSTFSNAVAHTGTFSAFSVPQYNSVTSPAIVKFDTVDSSATSVISLSTTTGQITLTSDISYLLTATVNTNRTVDGNNTSGYQWFNVTANAAIGPFVKFGEACTTTLTTSEATVVVLKAYSNESTFAYPNQLTGSFTAEVIGGY